MPLADAAHLTLQRFLRGRDAGLDLSREIEAEMREPLSSRTCLRPGSQLAIALSRSVQTRAASGILRWNVSTAPSWDIICALNCVSSLMPMVRWISSAARIASQRRRNAPGSIRMPARPMTYLVVSGLYLPRVFRRDSNTARASASASASRPCFTFIRATFNKSASMFWRICASGGG